MKGPRPTGDVPIGVNAAVGKDTRKGLAAMVDIEDGKIASVAFTPTFADEESRPAFLKADDPMLDRKSVVEGTRVSVRGDLGGRRIIKKIKNHKDMHKKST